MKRSAAVYACCTLFLGLAAACSQELLVGTNDGTSPDSGLDGASGGSSGSSGAHESSSGTGSSGTGSSGASSSGTGSSGMGSSGASSSGASGSVGCDLDLELSGPPVTIEVFEAAPPQQTGGTLVAGKYVLTAFRVYAAGPQGTGNVRETLVLTGSTAVGALAVVSEITEATGEIEPHGPRGSHRTFDGNVGSPALFTTEDCPSDDVSQLEFTARAGSLTTYDPFVFVERTYVRAD